MFDWLALGYGALMAGIDVVSLGMVKEVSAGTLKVWMMVFSTLIYALQPWIFLSAMSRSSLTIMNLMWDLTSDVMVTIVGLVYFKEKIGRIKMLGLVLAFIALFLMGYKEE
jgi:multidrug transporter EmrE-like cation transporter